MAASSCEQERGNFLFISTKFNGDEKEASRHDSRTPVHSQPGGTLGISGWGCAAGTLEPLTYTRASSAEFCYPILE